jgi:hypothetical protein
MMIKIVKRIAFINMALIHLFVYSLLYNIESFFISDKESNPDQTDHLFEHSNLLVSAYNHRLTAVNNYPVGAPNLLNL